MPHPTAPDNCPLTRLNTGQTGGEPSHVYPTTSGRQRLLVASGCIARNRIRDAVASLSWGFPWWQVLGSNQRRLSRRFYRPLDPTSHMPPDLQFCSRYRPSHPVLSAICPWIRHGACMKPRTGTDSVRACPATSTFTSHNLRNAALLPQARLPDQVHRGEPIRNRRPGVHPDLTRHPHRHR